jgi:23S rRNA (guanosine2251-2'-O)-methyltransferase
VVQALAWGVHAVTAALEKPAKSGMALCIDARRQDQRVLRVVELAQDRGIEIRRIRSSELDTLAEGGRHQGVVLLGQGSEVMLDESGLMDLFDALQEPAFFLVLDGITDPHNLGACLRSAEAAGVHAVILPRDRSASLTATARKVASGAAERVPLARVTNLSRTLEQLADAGVWIVGAAGETDTSVYQADLKGPLAIVMGAEDKGLRRLTREHCQQLVKIPMVGEIESLNVSVATGILLYEAVRQRRAP